MTAFHHIAINCIDRGEQEKFYTERLGFRRVRTFNAGTENEFVMLRLGDFCIELFPSPAAVPRPPAGEAPVGYAHLAFCVDDIATAADQLREAGVATDDIIDCSNIAPGFSVCFFKDPEGNVLELMQGWRDE
jgi:glyoxylase I family protein